MANQGQLRVAEPGGAPGEPRQVSLEVGEDSLSLVAGGEPVVLPFVDIDDLWDEDYTLRLVDSQGRTYELTMLGKAYGQIAADVRKRRNELLGHDLLLTGVDLQDTYPAKLLGGPSVAEVQVQLFTDLLVVIPERGVMWGVPFSFIDGVDWDGDLYQTKVRTDDGQVIVFGQMGRRSEEFRDELRRLLDALAVRTARTLTELLPGVDPATVGRLAAQMRDGRAVQRRAVDAIDPALWGRLEDAVMGTDELRQAYASLASRSPQGWAAIGVKATAPEGDQEEGGATAEAGSGEGGGAGDAMQQLLGQAMAGQAGRTEAPEGEPEEPPAEQKTSIQWYFVPLADDGGAPINAVAQEVTSEQGHATYVFRLLEPERWDEASKAGGDALADAVAGGIARLNRALLTLNFRREPILATDDEIATGRFARYRVAVRHLDHLRWARRSYLGRATHTDSWEQQVREAAAKA